MHKSLSKNNAFTLVELSIVLVILGLLVGGVLSGQALIRAAELRAVGNEHAAIKTAIHTFRDKYFAIPGDMANATAYWTSAGGTGSNQACRDVDSTGSKATCNGNGDSILQYSSLATVESFRFWQHLTNAELIWGNYSGTTATPRTSAWSTSAANAPTSKFNKGLWAVYTYVNTNCGGQCFTGSYGNTIELGAYASGFSGAPLFSPADLYNVDVKFDDGKPAKGQLVAFARSTDLTLCSTTADPNNLEADYLLSSKDVVCGANFINQF